MASPNYVPGVGALSTNRYDFENHINGFDFRHNSVQIDVNPPLIINGTSYITVADALSAISNFIVVSESGGQGFITVGDGYDTYANANGNPNFNPATPSLDTILNPLFTYLLNYYNNPNAANLAAIPAQYLRIKDGGVILLKAGTYTIKNTVLVPPGFTLLGESFGTKIVNQTSPQAPLFKILPDSSLVNGSRIADIGVDATTNNQLMFARDTQFINLTIADNFVEPTSSGNLSYRNPQNTTQPLILMEEGSSFVCNNVKFLGKTVYSSGNGVVSSVSAMPIQLSSSVPLASGTNLSIYNCMIDGFSEAIQFNVIGSAVNSHFSFKNNIVRIYGLLNGDPTSPANNCFLNLNNCFIDASYNFCYGNKNAAIPDGSTYTFVYLYQSATDADSANTSITIANNNGFIDKIDSGILTFFKPSADASLSGPPYASFVYNNTGNGDSIGTSINITDSTPQFAISSNDVSIGNSIVSSIFTEATTTILTGSTFDLNITNTNINSTNTHINSATTIIGGELEYISTLATPTLTQISPTIDAAAGTITIQAADAFSSASSHKNGGNIMISTGNSVAGGTLGVLTIQTGHGGSAIPILRTDASGNTYLQSGTSGQIELNNTAASFSNSIIILNGRTFDQFSGAASATPVQQEKVLHELAVFTSSGTSLQDVYTFPTSIFATANTTISVEVFWSVRDATVLTNSTSGKYTQLWSWSGSALALLGSTSIYQNGSGGNGCSIQLANTPSATLRVIPSFSTANAWQFDLYIHVV